MTQAQEKEKSDKGPLHWAVMRRDLQEVMRLIESGEEPDARDDKSNTPLHYLTWTLRQRARTSRLLRNDGDPMSNSTVAHCNDILSFLLARGADPNAANYKDQTPMHHAAGQASCDVLRLLLEAGGTLDNEDKTGRTPLMRLAERQRGAPAVSPGKEGAELVRLLAQYSDTANWSQQEWRYLATVADEEWLASLHQAVDLHLAKKSADILRSATRRVPVPARHARPAGL